MNQTHVYIVVGQTCDYESSRSWNVKSFFQKKKAIELQNKLIGWCKTNEILAGEGPLPDRNMVAAMKKRKCPLDEKFQVDSFGTYYKIDKIELESQ
jgi:hypothetical protein